MARSANTTRPEECNNNGFTTSTAWGYRVRAVWDYRNVFAGVSLRPNLAWSHDVEGYGPSTNPFNEGARGGEQKRHQGHKYREDRGKNYGSYFVGQHLAMDSLSWTYEAWPYRT